MLTTRVRLSLLVLTLAGLLLIPLIPRLGSPASAPTPAPSGAQYVGTEACRSCHAAAYDTWSKTAHAKDFSNYSYHNERMVNMYTERNGYCQACHVVGYGKPGGFDKAKPWPQQQALLRIGCEECHGPGSRHVSAAGEERRKSIGACRIPRSVSTAT